MKNAVIALVILAAVVSGYFLLRGLNQPSGLERYDLDGLTIEALLETLEERTDEPSTVQAYVNSSALTILADGENHSFDIPEGWFYLSVAPYLANTHPCGTHNLITCRGELKQQTFQVVVETAAGEIVMNETRTTHANGFMGLWLPSDMEGTITLTYGLLTASTNITTYSTSNTCLTTLQLS